MATRNTITCPDLLTFLAVVAGLVPLGLTFEACADRLTITLTGGY